MAAKLADIREKLRKRMHLSIETTVKWLQQVVRGYFAYYAIPGNWARMKAFRNDVLRLWLKQLQRRSQRTKWTWERFVTRLGNLLPEVHLQHPYPNVRFDAKMQGKNRVR
jgi:hypothetical protein